MRIAIIVVTVAVISSPSLASPSCMTISEARAAFPNKHLYWHGPNHCWDATPGRKRLAQRAKAKENEKERRQVRRETQIARHAEQAIVEEKKPPGWAQEARWREAMSRMLPEDMVALQPTVRVQARAEILETSMPSFEMPVEQRTNWRDRWVEVLPPADTGRPAAVVFSAAAAPELDPLLTPTRVILALLAVLLTLALVEILFRTAHRDWRR